MFRFLISLNSFSSKICNEENHMLMYKLSNWILLNRFVSINFNNTRQVLITHGMKWNQEFFYIIKFVNQVNSSTNIIISNKLFHFFMKFWMLPERKSCICGIFVKWQFPIFWIFFVGIIFWKELHFSMEGGRGSGGLHF